MGRQSEVDGSAKRADRAELQPVSGPAISVARSLEPPGPHTILIVGDNPELAASLAEICEAHGYRTVSAGSAREALEVAGQGGFDLALLDVGLPDGEGTALLEPLHTACPHAELILMTGRASVDSAIAALRSGAFGYVRKPLQIPELLGTMGRALHQVVLRREAERLQRHYAHVVENADLLIVGLDHAGVVILFNRKAQQVTGYSPDEVLGTQFVDLFGPLPTATAVGTSTGSTSLLEAATATLATPSPSPPSSSSPSSSPPSSPSSCSPASSATPPPLSGPGSLPRRRSSRQAQATPLRTRDGRERLITWHRTEVREQGGAVELTYILGLDVTEARQLERRTAQSERLAALGMLSAGLAHEIRNPLNAALLQLAVVERRLSRAEAGLRESGLEAASAIRSELDRLGRLVTEFLEFARPQPLRLAAGDVAALLHGVAAGLRSEALVAGVQVRVEPPPPLPRLVFDRDRMLQVLHNLARNAIEAMARSGTLTLRARAAVETVELEVEDDGPGLPEPEAPIFDAFYTTKNRGTGLGLAIVHRIVTDHGGAVRFESQPGRTVFTVAIPVSLEV